MENLFEARNTAVAFGQEYEMHVATTGRSFHVVTVASDIHALYDFPHDQGARPRSLF